MKISDINETYEERPDGFWCKRKYDDNGNETYYVDSYNDWRKSEYDDNGNLTYYVDSKHATIGEKCVG